MVNVADELAALRAKGSVKAKRSTLTSKGGLGHLSTPEAEAAALKAKKDQDKAGNIKARESMAKGSSAGGFDLETEHTLNQTGKKKAEWEKRSEAKKILSKGGSGKGGSAAVVADNSGKKAAAAPAKAPPAPATPAKKEEAVEKKGEAVETSNDADDDDDDDVPQLEEADDIPELDTAQIQQTAGSEVEAERQITNRNEKKARKMMTRLGMRPVPNIARATLKAGTGRGYFFIDRPDVFTSTGGKVDTYVMFGEAKHGGGGFGGGGGAQSAQAQAAMAQQQKAMAAAAGQGGGAAMPSLVEEDDDEGDVPDLVQEVGGADEEGVEAKDIDLVMSQASCSRAKAVAALKENDGDLVNAIMSLTT